MLEHDLLVDRRAHEGGECLPPPGSAEARQPTVRNVAQPRCERETEQVEQGEDVVGHAAGIDEVGDVLSPNLLVALNGTVLSWGKMTVEQPGNVRKVNDEYRFCVSHGGPQRYVRELSAESAELIDLDHNTEPFRELVCWIRKVYYRGRTPRIRSLDRYFTMRESTRHTVRTFSKLA